MDTFLYKAEALFYKCVPLGGVTAPEASSQIPQHCGCKYGVPTRKAGALKCVWSIFMIERQGDDKIKGKAEAHA